MIAKLDPPPTATNKGNWQNWIIPQTLSIFFGTGHLIIQPSNKVLLQTLYLIWEEICRNYDEEFMST
jgi:hypothetical protein